MPLHICCSFRCLRQKGALQFFGLGANFCVRYLRWEATAASSIVNEDLALSKRVNSVVELWDEFFFLQLLWELQSGGPVPEY